MMKVQNIKAIELGPRQMTFGFDNTCQEIQDSLISDVKSLFESHGRVLLDQVVEHAAQLHGLEQQDTLQSIFWSAEELKIHFRMNGKAVTPFEAKQILLEAPENFLEVVVNKNTTDEMFRDAVMFYQTLSRGKAKNVGNDQYRFALSLLADLTEWESCLKSLKLRAQKPFFPGEKRINDHLQSLNMLLAKKDSYSLISNCSHHKKTIAAIAADVKMLSAFYNQHADFWALLIQSIDTFEENLGEIEKNEVVFPAYQRLVRILASPCPYDLIPEADQLLTAVRSHHDRIVAEKTQIHCREAELEIQSMIENLSELLERTDSDLDRRNRLLYPLRLEEKKLQHAGNIQQIDQLLNHTKDMVDDFIEDLKELGQGLIP